MPRYFFHTADGGRDRDTDGVELDGAHCARVEAIRYAGAIMSQDPDVVWDGRDFRVLVTDEAEELVCTVVTLAVENPLRP